METRGSVLKSCETSNKQTSGNRKLWPDTHGMESKEIALELEDWIHLPQNADKLRAQEHGNKTWRHGDGVKLPS